MDAHFGKSFEHRRRWIQDRMRQLADVFAIDLCAYSVMSNHYHVVLHIDHAQAQRWDDLDVVRRWRRLDAGHPLAEQFGEGKSLSEAERDLVQERVSVWRRRLADISWYMRCLNESIARQANSEDQCTGRFWEGRFKSQALLDEKALAACLAYVDLNPIRAGMAETPEASDHTSVQERIREALAGAEVGTMQPPHLMPFVVNPREEIPKGLPFRLSDYLKLVDWTGRVLRDDKRGAIPADAPPILERLKIDPQYWISMAKHFESRFKGLVGAAYQLKAACRKLGYRRTPNLANCRALLA